MSTRQDPSSSIGRRIRRFRTEMRLTQKDLAARASVDRFWLNRIENENLDISPEDPRLATIAAVLRISPLQLTSDQTAVTVLATTDNPKPLVIGRHVVPEIFEMFGTPTDILRLGVTYSPVRLAIPPLIRGSVYDRLAAEAKQRANAERRHYDTTIPNTRLISVKNTLSQDPVSGLEQGGLVIELGPLNWEEFTVLNARLDVPLFNTEPRTIRLRFADPIRVFNDPHNIGSSRLSNLFCVSAIPITVDGYGLAQLRSLRGVSDYPGRLTSGIAENIHRYRDEAAAANLFEPAHLLDLPAPTAVDDSYAPRAGFVPSPYLAAQWGLRNELSPSLFAVVRNSPNRFKFLCIAFDTIQFLPFITGVVELPLTLEEVSAIISEDRGSEHAEWTAIEYLKLDIAREETRKTILADDRWVPTGRAAFVHAIKYWQSRL